MACGAHEDPPPRDKSDWRFEDANTHFETHGPFNLELFADKDNHILPVYCTTPDSCFDKDWAGKACYGNPPFEHDLILQCLQKPIRDHARQPSTTKFLLILPKWVTATWWDLTKQFTVIHAYPEGSRIFSAPLQSCYNTDDLEHCGDDRVWICDTKWPVVVLYKDGHTVAQLDRKMLQHVRLGHISDKSMYRMMEEGVPLGITEAEYNNSQVTHCPDTCISCRLTKATRPPAKATYRDCAAEMGTLIWSDTPGPFRTSAGGYRWYVLFIDDCTSWTWIHFLKRKSDYLSALQLCIVEVRKFRSKMGLAAEHHMTLHTDGDSTMISGQTAAYCQQHGIEQQHGSPYLHQNQSRVERAHRHIQAMTRALLMTSGFGVEMWPLSARHSVYIDNKMLKDWTSAFYQVEQKHADLSNLRVFGCLAYAFTDPDVRDHKLSDRARQLRYVGHSEVSSAYLLYDGDSGKVVKSGMVQFCERLDQLGKVITTWDPSVILPLKTDFTITVLDAPYKDPPPAAVGTSVVELGTYLPEDSDEVLAVVKVQHETGLCWVSLRTYLEKRSDRLPALRTQLALTTLNAHYALFTEVTVHTDKKPESAMVCARAVGTHAYPYCVVLLTNFTYMDVAAGKVHFPLEHTCLSSCAQPAPEGSNGALPRGVTEPKSYKQALAAPDSAEWLESIQAELEALVRIKGGLLMMKEEDVPYGYKLLDMSLVLRVKLDKYRELQKRKARRICAKGNKQEYGVDYLDTFAPCTQLSSMRMVIIVALNLGLTVYHMDVDTAFLNPDLDEDLYVRLPHAV
ncbi:hypothetical protein CYMTET_52638 [Cymbomonas tetramitiformis]|uniref:Integrase catalytic domain-containing protein n=1 Tax=Cymbomonas tetramitiformis TaxID=36881 RepID=A0AAE0BIM9_9CHLO|nr:hypothetical protein CYMTET_52638 [Cymbomonas tetramitiformis]